MAKKKKQSKLRRIVSALNPTNPKGMALLFALIFALSGAGVYLYQSFAATYEKVFLANQITALDTPNSYSPQKVTETSGDKKNITVWNVPKDDGVSSVHFSLPGGNYNFCVTAKYLMPTGSSGTAKITIWLSGDGDASGLGAEESKSFSTSYSKRCIAKSLSHGSGYDVFIYNARDYNLRVSSISIEKL